MSLDLGTPDFAVVVYGIPGPQGSKKARPIYKGRGADRVFTGRTAMEESSKKVKPWRAEVVKAAKSAARACGLVTFDGPLVADVVFSFARPKGHFRTGRNAHLLRDAAPTHHTVYPDVSKILRSTEDALTDAGVWADDARVVEYGRLAKVYANSPDPDALTASGVVIRLWKLSLEVGA